jgi:carboxypeptidase C (cathepsin A)
MRFSLIYSILILAFIGKSFAQRSLPADTLLVSQGQVTVKGKNVPYTVKTGTMPVWDKDGKASASLFFTYYERSDIKDKATRPIVFSFNGGPGSASVWMHIAYTGPKLLEIDSEGYPVQPYGIKDNPHSILDVADIVYIDPVNTGFSRILDKEAKKEQFFGVNADVKYLADWLSNFVSRHGRWLSPKFLIGESYGTTRVSGLALELQNAQWMYLNGVILVSPTGLGINRGAQIEAANRLPYFTAAAWYHKALKPELQKRKLEDLLEEVEQYTVSELIPIMAEGGFVSDEKRKAAAEKMSFYTGISSKVILQQNLDVPTSFFWKELLRDKGYNIGRLDSRYLGIDRKESGDSPDYSAELTSWLHSFTPPINYYLRDILKVKTDLPYIMLGNVGPWDRSNDNTGNNLRQAMAQNPYLKVMFQCGYFDGGTTYFEAKYTMWQLDPSGKMKDRLRFEGYHSGHMMYLREEDLASSNEHVRDFILKSVPQKKEAAKY